LARRDIDPFPESRAQSGANHSREPAPAIEISSYVFAVVQQAEFTLYRGHREGFDPILLATPPAERASPTAVRRLEHEYSLRTELESRWAALPIALDRYQNRIALVRMDPGGEPLAGVLREPLDTLQFLRLAVTLAAACGQMHARGLIHKDIKPDNVLVDVAGRGAWLTNFGIASRLPREHLRGIPTEVIAGTLAYMAPEQTGRMNRSIDSRSDLYALGVTFYEMVVGALPFTSDDPMELVHWHLARQPIPPRERNLTVPEQISSIVMRLLAKAPEERYQTAAGVEADLRQCLRAWDSSRRIDPFPIGANDASDRLLIPEKLYGRDRERDTLLGAFERVVATGVPELVLVSGYSGIGKSSIVNELHKALVPPRGLFAAGKFDQHKRDIPYATLVQALQGLVHQILATTDAELTSWRNALTNALGPNGELMVNLIPALELVIGKQAPVPELPPKEAQSRFQLVFRRFLAVFATPEHPLALFLDDLQWLDAATLGLLEWLVAAPELSHLLLVGAYRDNEVDTSHPLMRTLATIRNAGGRVHEITLAPLKPHDVAQLVADSLRAEPARTRPLADLVFEKTSGNPFFVIQFVTALAEARLLTFDANAGTWRWDTDRIRARDITDNVVDLMAVKLSRLPETTLEALKQLACLGNTAPTAVLAMVLGKAEEATQAALWNAERAGLIVRRGATYSFLHDRVHEASYALTPEAERAAMHLRIGRVFASQFSSGQIEQNIFEVVNHFNRGAALIDSLEEREQVAAFNLTAGKRAKASTAYATALAHFTAGRAFLAPESWVQQYAMTFELEIRSAECEFLTGALAAADERLSALAKRAANVMDRAAVARLRVALYTTLNRSDRAIDVGLQYMRHVGLDWSPHPTDAEVRQEYERMQRLLARQPFEQLVDLPLLGPEWQATMNVLSDMMPPLLYTSGNLHDLALLRIVNISLEHGHCDGSCYPFARLQQVLGYRFGDYQTAFRFGELACDLVDKRGMDRFKARVYMAFAIFVVAWSRHLPEARPMLERALEAANATGDLPFAIYTIWHLTANLFVSGEPLREVQEEAEKRLAIARKSRFGIVIDAFIGQLILIRSLRGLTPDAVSAEDEGRGTGWFERHLAQSPHQSLPACFYWIRKLQACFIERNIAGGLEAAATARELLWSSRAMIETAEYHFYAALVRAAACGSAPADMRDQHFTALCDHRRQIALWAEHCPENFGNRKALVDAEVARLEGRELDAERLYEEAIRSAREYAFVQNEAIAYELAAHFYAGRGFETIAQLYLRNARECYGRWGADGKVNLLDQSYPFLRQESDSSRDQFGGTSVDQLDLATVIKVSQAVSGEIELTRLLERLMVTALGHAGAELGLLMLAHGDGLRIEARAVTVGQNVEVSLHQIAAPDAELPLSVLRYVMRTHDSVLLDDASAQEHYSADEYIRRHRSRSILCIPLIKQAALIGILYLENSKISHVFTPDRVAVLKLLASQAAIALENARLYTELVAENLERRKAEVALRASEASLAEGQRISHTGSWRWNVRTGAVQGSAECFRIFALDPSIEGPSLEKYIERVHPEDRPLVEQALGRAMRDRSIFKYESRIVLPDGSVRHVQSTGQPDVDAAGELEFVGTVMDITERRQAEEALRRSQAELARAAGLSTMGELAASIIHEINQPLAAVVGNAEVSLRWLNRDPPDLTEARDAISRLVRDGWRAADVVKGLRALAQKSGLELARMDLNEAMGEVLTLLRGELQRGKIVLHLAFPDDNQQVVGDRVQLQQVLLNLIRNGIEAMSTVTDRPRLLKVSVQHHDVDQALVAVEDAGTGLDPAIAERVFDPLFTTKSDGMGMGLSICRSIVEAHGGRLWASPNSPHGTIFRFTVPLATDPG
jgi:predicted ATPase/signal transduction histidine kinase/GAF domain-containing protein